MKYVILVLLLLTFGCTQPAATENGNVTDTVPSNDTSDVAADDSSSDETTNDSGSDEQTDDSANASDAGSDLIVPTNSEWGTECEYKSDCGSFKDMKDCVMGHCVDMECNFKSDCKDKDHCFRNRCYLESELLAEFPPCGVNIGCNTTCSTCKSGHRRCTITGWQEGDETKDWYICTECGSDHDCLDGYRCVQRYCVEGPN